MIEKDFVLKPDTIVRHDGGLLYKVDDSRRCTDGYETTHQIGGIVVNYTQLQAGTYPEGTKWSKSEDEFRAYFTVVDTTDDF